MAKAKQTVVETENDTGPGPITPEQDILIATAIAAARARNAGDEELTKIVSEIREKGE